jgi:hypothetical protein
MRKAEQHATSRCGSRIPHSLFVLAAAAAGCAPAEFARPPELDPDPNDRRLKRTVAVLAVRDATGRNPATADAAGEMLLTELDRTGRFVVVERGRIAEVLRERRLDAAGVTTGPQALEVGKLLGVELLLAVGLTDVQERSTAWPWRGRHEVGVDGRLIETRTGRVVFAGEGRAAAEDGRSAEGSGPPGPVVRAALDDLLIKMMPKVGGVPWRGMIAAISDAGPYLAGGSQLGYKVGDRFEVVRVGKLIRHPITQEILGAEEKRLAGVEITEVQERVALCRVLDGGDIRIGDGVRRPPPPKAAAAAR